MSKKGKVADLATEIVDFSKIKPMPKNPRVDLQPDDDDYKAIDESLEEDGYYDPIVWNKQTGHLIAGHQRLKILKDQGYTGARVSVVDVDSKKEKRMNVRHNAAQGRWDYELLPETLLEMKEEGIDITHLGFNESELENILHSADAELEEVMKKVMEKRGKINWDSFKVFHVAASEDQLYLLRTLNYLASFGLFNGKITTLPKPPKVELFIDSGVISGARKQGVKYLERQGEVVEWAKAMKGDYCTMMDIPLFPEILKELGISKNRASEIHHENAKAFSKEKLDGIKKVYVVQGPSLQEYKECLGEYRKFVKPGDVIAVGGIKDKSGDLDFIGGIVAEVHKRFPDCGIHLFGIGSAVTVSRCIQLGATSCDNSTGSIAMKFVGGISRCTRNKEGNWSARQTGFKEFMDYPSQMAIGGKLWDAITIFGCAQIETALRLQYMKDTGELVENLDEIEKMEAEITEKVRGEE